MVLGPAMDRDCEDGVVILQEKPAEEFEPTDEEVRNYAEWLGMDPQTDKDLMYLAKEGLKAPLTDGWKPCQNSEGEIFYFNFESGESSWDHPADETYRHIAQAKKVEKSRGGPKVAHAPLSAQHVDHRGLHAKALHVQEQQNGFFLRCKCFRRCCARKPQAPMIPK